MNDKKGNLRIIAKKGFSLTETIIALTILALIAAGVSVSFLSVAPKYRLQSAVRQVQSRLNYARYKSIFETVKVRIKFNPTGYSLEKYDEEQKEWMKEREFFLQGVTLRSNNSPVFHPEGTVSSLASITISNSWGAYRITLAISGRIKTVRL